MGEDIRDVLARVAEEADREEMAGGGSRPRWRHRPSPAAAVQAALSRHRRRERFLRANGYRDS